MAYHKKSYSQILEEIENLSDSLFKRDRNRRTASLTLPRNEVPSFLSTGNKDEPNRSRRERRISFSSFSSRPIDLADDERVQNRRISSADETFASSDKKGMWSWKWKPIRALAHLGKQKLSCLFSIEVVTIRNLPTVMTALRLAVCVRKKESRDGSAQTMPSRVLQGTATFDETLFLRCHVYFSPGSGTMLKFEPRPFLIYPVAVDSEGLDFGRSSVDLAALIQESIDKSFDGVRIRKWDRAFALSGKAKGGELVMKLGFQIMEKDGGVGIYNQAEKGEKSRRQSSSFGRKQSKSSFSIPSTRMSSRLESVAASDDEGDDNDVPEFDVVDKGVEIEGKKEGQAEEQKSDKKTAATTGEVVKEVVQDQSHLIRLKELNSIAQQIRALESVMEEGKELKIDEETGSQTLDAEEDKLTREFLQMLDYPQNEKEFKAGSDENAHKHEPEDKKDEEKVYVPDLGKGLGCVVQTRHGGYLAAANPLGTLVRRKDEPKLAVQMSKPLVIGSSKTRIELFQKMAAIGFEELTSKISTLMPMDELTGKTAEKIAFEGIASAIIQGRSKEGARSSASRIIAAVKSMATTMNSGRKDQGPAEDPLTVDEILAYTLPKIETMAIEALKIQADITEDAAPFEASPLDTKTPNPLTSAVPIEDWIKSSADNATLNSEGITITVVIQLRDPSRQYEAVGGPMIVLINGNSVSEKCDGEEKRYNVGSVQVGGVKVRTLRGRNVWDGERQKLTALQFLVEHGLRKAGKNLKVMVATGPDVVWSLHSRVVGDVWMKSTRNPDVKLSK